MNGFRNSGFWTINAATGRQKAFHAAHSARVQSASMETAGERFKMQKPCRRSAKGVRASIKRQASWKKEGPGIIPALIQEKVWRLYTAQDSTPLQRIRTGRTSLLLQPQRLHGNRLGWACLNASSALAALGDHRTVWINLLRANIDARMAVYAFAAQANSFIHMGLEGLVGARYQPDERS